MPPHLFDPRTGNLLWINQNTARLACASSTSPRFGRMNSQIIFEKPPTSMVKCVVWGVCGLDSERIPENERDCYLWVQGGPPDPVITGLK